MCVVCTDWLKGKMTNDEALRALGELIGSTEDFQKEDHYHQVAEKIEKQERDKAK